jgi:hypothetical protein
MKDIIIPIIIFLYGFQLAFSQDIIGDSWEGYLDQSAAASKMDGYKDYWKKGIWKKGKKSHDLKLTFKYNEKKKKIIGEYYINEVVKKAHYGRFSLEATVSNKKVRYKTTGKIFETKNQLNLGFCHSSATLTYNEDKYYEYLEGEWRGWNDASRACAGAHVWVRRKKKGVEPPPEPKPPVLVEEKDTVKEPELVIVEKIDTLVEMKIDTLATIPVPPEPPIVQKDYSDRKLLTKDKMYVSKDSILVQIWDANRVDGDIVSLQFNGKLILKNYLLTSIPKSVIVYLKQGENVLTLIAHNLGAIPPNTAALSIEREEGHKTIILKSDMDQSESIIILKQ